MNRVIEIVDQSLMITGFVFVMMLVVEYVNVLTSGTWQRLMARSRWVQYALAALLGATPGCLGAFAVVAMYSHRVISLGAVVAAMIATSGDESFVMLATIPNSALTLTGILLVLGMAFGFITDKLADRFSMLRVQPCEELTVHTIENCECFPRGRILSQWRTRSPFRTILTLSLALFIFFVALGRIGSFGWGWERISILIAGGTVVILAPLTVLVAGGIALFVVTTVPDHFLQKHFWNHVVRKHLPLLFLWTLGTLAAMEILLGQLDLGKAIESNLWTVLGIASLIGLIPESGPHLIFVMLFARGTIPFSILLASSIVQDGHGMLPMLAHSRKAFVAVKLVNLVAVISVGAISLALAG